MLDLVEKVHFNTSCFENILDYIVKVMILHVIVVTSIELNVVSYYLFMEANKGPSLMHQHVPGKYFSLHFISINDIPILQIRNNDLVKILPFYR